MIRRFRAYDEALDKWIYFKILVYDTEWELRYPYVIVGDKCKASLDDNFNVAYANLLSAVEKMNLKYLTELYGSEL